MQMALYGDTTRSISADFIPVQHGDAVNASESLMEQLIVVVLVLEVERELPW